MARRFPRQHSSIVAHKEWIDMNNTLTAIDLAEGTVGLGPQGLVAGFANTILRLRGIIGVQLDPGGVDERVLVTFGIIVTTAVAFATGTTALPSPVAESDKDWMWIGSAFLTSGAEAAVIPDRLSAEIEVDSKAMRKVKPNDTVVLIGEVAESVDQTGTWDFQYYVRMLSGN